MNLEIRGQKKQQHFELISSRVGSILFQLNSTLLQALAL